MRVPNKIGRYRLVHRVGAGGMGVVYQAVDSRDGKEVALKILLPHAAEEKEGVVRFKREFRALARLRHPNIVRVHDAGIENDIPFIAMEFLRGKDVRHHLRALPEGPVRDHEAIRVLRQIFGALSHIHARRIVHRDLKPENILVTEDGRVKLMDFGVARFVRTPETSNGLLGTFAYMAPEQVTTGEIDGRSDLYAIGVILFELLTDEYPFPVEPPAAALHHHVNTPPQLVRHLKPKANPMLAALAHRLLEKDPMDRPQSADDAARFLADSAIATAALPDVSRELPGLLFVPRFVARASFLEELEGVVSDASAGRGALVVVEGPSGIGKSRLIEELRLRVRRRTHVLVGAAAPDGAQAYGAIEPVLDAIASIAQNAPKDVVHRIVGRDAALVSTISPRLASFGARITATQLDANERKIRLHKAVVGVLGRLALTRAVVLILEDVHWADVLTLELLWDAARTLLAPRPGGVRGETVCPVAMILSRRTASEGPDRSEVLVRRLEQKGGVRRVNLSALSIEHVAEMIRTMTGVRQPAPALVAEVTEAAHGLPLLVQEVIHALVRDEALVRVHGVWSFRGEPADTSADAAALDLDTPIDRQARPRPAPARDIVLGKLQVFDEATRALVDKLALLGRLLPSDLVAALAEVGEDSFLDAMDTLVRGDVLIEEVSPDGVRYRFFHEGFREAVVKALPRSRRRELHLAIGQRIERRFSRRRRELAHVLARHFRQGGHPERAVRYLVMLAEAAEIRGDFDGAMRYLSDAIGFIDEEPATPARLARRARLLVLQIELLLDFGRAQEALDRADPQVGLRARSPKVSSAEIMLRRAACHFAMGNLDETLAALGRMPRPAPTRALGVRALDLEGRTRVARGEYDEARAVLEAARDIARASGLTELWRELEAAVGVVVYHQGHYGDALERLEASLAYARSRGHTKLIAELVGHVGLIHAARDHTTEALACYQEALEIAEARGMRADLERWSGALGMLMSELGEFDDAKEKLENALAIATETGNRQGIAKWRGELGVHHLLAGDADGASQQLLRCLAVAREIGYSRYEAWAQIYLGAVGMERDLDRLDEARERIEQGLEIADDLGNEEIRIAGLFQLGRLERAAGDRVRALETLELADRLATATQNLRLRARIRLELEVV